MSPRPAIHVSTLVVVLFALMQPACAPMARKEFTPEELQKELDRRVSAEIREDIIVPFEIDDEIRELAHHVTDGLLDDREKMRAIVRAIIDRTGMSISYDWLSNKSAKEVYYEGRGNCLAYTNLFVGMAREVGLRAVYVDVTTIERVTREAEVIVNNGHVTGGLIYGPETIVIDFTRTPEREYMGYKVIDDLEAIANYYNNQGFLYGYFTEMQADGMGFDPQALEMEMYRAALEVLPTFQRARNNLGVAFKRRGRVDEAIEQYKMAIDVDPSFAEAHSNLGSAYYSLGRIDEAIEEFRIAAKSSGSNAYFHHHLGVLQYQLKNYDDAIDQFKKALAREPQLADARFYLGECYLKKGDESRAIKEFEATLELDPNYLSARAKLNLLQARIKSPM